MEKYLDIIHDVVLWHFATYTDVNLSYMCPGRDFELHPLWVKLYQIGCVGHGFALAKALT